MTPTRKAIAKAMVNSKHTAPHVTLHDEVEVSKLWDHRKKFKDVCAGKINILTISLPQQKQHLKRSRHLKQRQKPLLLI